jgi:hypothetical protein
MNEDWSRRQRIAILMASAGAAAVLWSTGDREAGNVAFILLSVGGAAAVAWLMHSRPAAAFGILFLLAALSRGTIETPVGNMRFEQPAIVAGLAAFLVARSRLDVARLRELWPIGAAFGVYLVSLGLSSILFAPDRVDSLRMTFWTGLSMSGGLLAFMLLSREGARATAWMCASGYVQAVAGFVFAILFFTLGPVLLAGPTPAPGIQEPLSLMPKVFSLSWEANIYASLLAALAPIGINRLLSSGRALDMLLLPVMVAALALGVTRGAYLGLAAGVAIYALFAVAPWRFWRWPNVRRVSLRVAVVTASLGVGLLLAGALLQGGRPPTKPLDFTQPNWGRGAVVAASGGTTLPVQVQFDTDTVAFRFARVPVAMADLSHSIVVGLGANSFGQRHEDASTAGPDHIAILAVAALYESGVLGATGLGIGFGLILLSLFKASRRRADRGRIAAYAGALVCLLVAYEATNALNFALIWLIAGAGLAAATEPIEPSRAERPALAG